MNLEIIIPSDEPVRLLSAVLGKLDYRKLTATNSRIRRIEYAPRLLFKVVPYACCPGIYSESAVFIDGTKIEANAGRYTFVWKPRVAKDQEKLGNKIAAELPLFLEKAGAGITVHKQITVPQLKKLRKKLYAQKDKLKTAFVYGKGHHKSGLQRQLKPLTVGWNG